MSYVSDEKLLQGRLKIFNFSEDFEETFQKLYQKNRKEIVAVSNGL